MSRRSLILIMVLAVAWYLWFVQPDDRKSGNGAVGKKAPPILLYDEQGQKISLSDFRGKVVLVHFWATWCAPCAEELPILDAFQKKMPSDQFALLAISEDEEERDVDQFRKKIPFSFSVLFDSGQKTADAFGTYRLPESFLIDKQGVIVKKLSGPQNWTHPKWEKTIRELF